MTKKLLTGLVLTLLFCQAQPALRDVKTIYVGSFGEGPGANLIRSKIISDLVKSKRVEVVETVDRADAVLTGIGETSMVPGYSGDLVAYATAGARLVGKDQKILWAGNASSSRMTFSGSATSGVANRIVKDLLKSMQQR